MKKHLLGKCCGGSRLAGDGRFTECKVYGPVTLCCGCLQIIQPEWLLSPKEREEMQREGRVGMVTMIT